MWGTLQSHDVSQEMGQSAVTSVRRQLGQLTAPDLTKLDRTVIDDELLFCSSPDWLNPGLIFFRKRPIREHH